VKLLLSINLKHGAPTALWLRAPEIISAFS
jgi:hypothetical protein